VGQTTGVPGLITNPITPKGREEVEGKL